MTPIEHVPPKEMAGRLAEGIDWREVVAWVSDLPPISHIATQAIRVVEDPNSNSEDLAKIISMDPALAARVLKIANSAMFSRQREITTISKAVIIIGFKALKGIAIAATLRQMASDSGALQKMVWSNSICSALSAAILARKLKKPYHDEVFVLGLLHNLGQIVLLAQKETNKKYKDVLNRIKEFNEDYVTAEQSSLGFNHALIGALVAKKWNFSDETCQIILHYKDPFEEVSVEGLLEEKTLIVQLAELFSHAAGSGSPEGYPDQSSEMKKLALLLGFNKDTVDKDLEDLKSGIQEQFAKESHSYQ